MQDHVAEVLADRAAVRSSAALGVGFSLAAHALLAAAVYWTALHQPPPEMVNTLTIKFAKFPDIQPQRPAAPARRSLPVIHEPRPVVPEPKKAIVPPAKNTAPPSPFGRSTKTASEVVPPAPAPPAITAGPQQNAADIAVGTSGVTGLEGGDFPYTVYIENMKRLIGTHWFRPDVGGGASTTVYFVINRDGSIRDARTETASGNGTFDRGALRAILESSPLPPLPFQYNGTFLGVHLTFK